MTTKVSGSYIEDTVVKFSDQSAAGITAGSKTNAKDNLGIGTTDTLTLAALNVGEDDFNLFDEGYFSPNILCALVDVSKAAVAASATITVDNTGAPPPGVEYIGEGDTIALIASDTSVVTLTMQGQAGATTSTSTSGDTLTAKTLASGSYATSALHATAQAVEIKTAINNHTKFTATNSSNVVTVTQAVAGLGGNTVITITELGSTGLSKSDFSGGLGSFGYYTKIGKKVFFQATLSFNNGTNTGTMTATGLPFASTKALDQGIDFQTGSYMDNAPYLTANIPAAGSSIHFWVQPSSTSSTRNAMSNSHCKASTDLTMYLSGMYLV